MNKLMTTPINFKGYALWLWVLFGLFCFRVISQLLQSKFSVPFLPPFEVWHSGALPYQYLVLLQLLIVIIYGAICIRFTLEKVVPKKWIGKFFITLGVLYAGAMAIRLFVGLFANSSAWFHAYLPIFFHFILALFLLVVGLFHLKNFDFHDS